MSIAEIKPGVQLYGTKPEMAIVHAVVASIFAKHGYDCTITSAIGKQHKNRSLHPVGYAHDYRTKTIPADVKRKIFGELRVALPCCDMLFEYEGQPQEHFHIEFDPKDDVQWAEDKAYYIKHGKWADR